MSILTFVMHIFRFILQTHMTANPPQNTIDILVLKIVQKLNTENL